MNLKYLKPTLREKVKEIVELAQDIFKEEWERVKKGE